MGRCLLPLILILLVALAPGCAPASPPLGGTEVGSPSLAAAPTPDRPFDFSGVHLRLHNAGDFALEAVQLVTGGETVTLPVLAPGAYSAYHTFPVSGQPVAVRGRGADGFYTWTAGQELVEGLLAGGEYTLELGLEDGAPVILLVMDNPLLQDAQAYAEALDISLEEALARLDAPTGDAISALDNRLQASEAATFAGLWIEHTPAYRVVVAFTADGEETIARYLPADSALGKVVEVVPARFTYAQLQADQEALDNLLVRLDFPAAHGLAVPENRVELYLTDRAAFEEALAEAGATLPESVTVVTTYEPLGDEPPFAITPAPDVFMPRLKVRDTAFMAALLSGELVVEDGCLRVRSPEGSVLVIWQADMFLTDNGGRLEVLDEKGQVVARVGETVNMGGGEVPAAPASQLEEPIPASCAAGPYWRMGEVLPATAVPASPSPAAETLGATSTLTSLAPRTLPAATPTPTPATRPALPPTAEGAGDATGCPGGWSYEWFFTPAPPGCPGTAATSTLAAAQPFEHGLMIWLEDADTITVFFGDGEYLIFAPSLALATPAPGQAAGLEAPPGFFAPVSGFGLVWRGEIAGAEGVGERLGWALAPEANYTAWQQYDTGSGEGASGPRYVLRPDNLYLSTPDGRIIAYNHNRWRWWPE